MSAFLTMIGMNEGCIQGIPRNEITEAPAFKSEVEDQLIQNVESVLSTEFQDVSQVASNRPMGIGLINGPSDEITVLMALLGLQMGQQAARPQDPKNSEAFYIIKSKEE